MKVLLFVGLEKLNIFMPIFGNSSDMKSISETVLYLIQQGHKVRLAVHADLVEKYSQSLSGNNDVNMDNLQIVPLKNL